MIRLFHHAEWLVEGGEIKCSQCGAKLDPQSPLLRFLLYPKPCSLPLSSVLYDEGKGLLWYIYVWDCKASLICMDLEGRLRQVSIAPEVQKQVETCIMEAIEKEGAINLSGLYSFPDSLIPYLEQGKIMAR